MAPRWKSFVPHPEDDRPVPSSGRKLYTAVKRKHPDAVEGWVVEQAPSTARDSPIRQGLERRAMFWRPSSISILDNFEGGNDFSEEHTHALMVSR